ncbi:unnamed protein product [Phytophthora lilii]|uniref:Unnamed protein product n=1 Tax=Phytophthora lilii TaxID=2077276 RepID=A0A9W6U0H3_9STRA|nr:unnamed protein product [Phytophthora lilii]
MDSHARHAYGALTPTEPTPSPRNDLDEDFESSVEPTQQLLDRSRAEKSRKVAGAKNGTSLKYTVLSINDATESSKTETLSANDVVVTDDLVVENGDKGNHCGYCIQSTSAVIDLALISLLVVALSSASSPLVADLALNTPLNELLGHPLQPSVDSSSSAIDDGSLPWVETYIHHATENHELFGNDTLYRRTTSFKGDLAFDVNVSDKNPPNVLLLVVESFRFHDSHYLVGEEDPSNLFKNTNISITPNFDRWAKRGIALRNYWSSWRTSRSVESLLFGQLPYDSVTKSGMTGGRRDTRLSGLTQFFKSKGYETFFTLAV